MRLIWIDFFSWNSFFFLVIVWCHRGCFISPDFFIHDDNRRCCWLFVLCAMPRQFTKSILPFVFVQVLILLSTRYSYTNSPKKKKQFALPICRCFSFLYWPTFFLWRDFFSISIPFIFSSFFLAFVLLSFRRFNSWPFLLSHHRNSRQLWQSSSFHYSHTYSIQFRRGVRYIFGCGLFFTPRSSANYLSSVSKFFTFFPSLLSRIKLFGLQAYSDDEFTHTHTHTPLWYRKTSVFIINSIYANYFVYT